MSDRQLVAFAGETNGKITLVDWRQPAGHNHRVIREAGDVTPLTEHVGDIDADPAQWEDALKVSGCINLTVTANVVRGGREDVLDVNHSRNCTVIIEDAYPRGNFVSTIKGESDGITFIVKRQHGHGKDVDYDLGNHSDQGDGNTRNVLIQADAFGEPVTVRTLRYAGKPQLKGGPFRYVFPWPQPKWLHDLCVWVLNLLQR
jgi:hypothetical protein